MELNTAARDQERQERGLYTSGVMHGEGMQYSVTAAQLVKIGNSEDLAIQTAPASCGTFGEVSCPRGEDHEPCTMII